MINETGHDGGRHVAGKYRVTEQCYNAPGNCLQLATASIAPVNRSLIYSVEIAAAKPTQRRLASTKTLVLVTCQLHSSDTQVPMDSLLCQAGE